MANVSVSPTPSSPAPIDSPSVNPTLSWLTSAVEEGEAFLASQPGWDQIGKSIDAIMGTDDDTPFDPKSALSQTKTNRIAKIAEDLAALLTDTKPFWDYSVSNRRFEQHAQIYGKLATFWYQRRNIDLRLADAIKYYVAAGTGYLHLFWNPDIEDMDAVAEDPRNVIPIRPLGYESLESCLGVVIKRKVPINYVRDRYGIDVKPESDGSALTWLKGKIDSVSDTISPIWRFKKNSKAGEPDIPRIPTTTLYTCYLKDDRKNESGEVKYMGEWTDPDPYTGERKPKYNWCYKVDPGDKLFPNRRMIVWVGDQIVYDGPSLYWHGQFPIIKLTLNPFPWSWLGKAPVWDQLRLQTALNRLLRVIDDHAAQVAQPGAIVDKNNVSKAAFDTLDTRRAGWKAYQNPLAGKGIQIVSPPPLDASIWEHVKWIINEMNELSGVQDVSRLTDLKQLPSNDTVSSILNQLTPQLRFRSRILEAFAREVAMQFAYNATQFYTLPMRVAELGPGGITQDDFDYDPGTLVPDFVHDTDYSPSGDIAPEALLRGPLPRFDRARELLRRFVFKISPASWLNSAQVEQKMIYLQLARAGWMDIFTLWETLGIPNTGVLPDNVRTIPERLQYQAQLGLNGQVNAAGRKATGQDVPRITVKES